ncbi:MAG: DsrE family protein [Candidatus Cloacimonetes bacterium]|nr:DsrE family protein [Candidatus Cloacimonadota bacterium]
MSTIQVVFLTSDKVGADEPALGSRLMTGVVDLLDQLPVLVKSVLLTNTAVFLATKNSDTITSLKRLEGQGVEILVCTTCLNHFGLMESLQVGKASDAKTILSTMVLADKVLKF